MPDSEHPDRLTRTAGKDRPGKDRLTCRTANTRTG